MLVELAEEFGQLLGRNAGFGPDTTLGTTDAAEFRRLCAEARSLLDSQLGANEHSSSLTAQQLVSPTYSNVESAYNSVTAAANTVRRQAHLAAVAKSASAPKVSSYVSETRLSELRAIAPAKWCLTRLVRLCEELNTNHEMGCLMSVAMNVRSIIDHVPPIFGCSDFNGVANHYAPTSSIKASLQALQTPLRKVADAHMHLQIRRREVLPTAPQVDFKSALDVLLGEIVRTLKP